MKNIQIYHPDKYETAAYTKVAENIYQGINPYRDGDDDNKVMYFTSLSFEQEPELGEGDTPAHISQYPLEGILDMFYLCITDFYDELNQKSACTCYQEFGGDDVDSIGALLEIVGKHVYNERCVVTADEIDDEEELEAYRAMSEEELEEEGYIFYETVIQ